MNEDGHQNLSRRASPLQDLWSEMKIASVPDPLGVELRELPFLAQVNIRADPEDETLVAALRGFLGFSLPTVPNTVNSEPGSHISALWLGPDEWLLVGPPGSEENITTGLHEALAGRHNSVVDLSASRTTIELAGERSRQVIAKTCSLDIHPRVFQPRQCAQTNFARTTVIVEQMDSRPTWRLYVRNSFAVYLASWLMDAMREYAIGRKNLVLYSHP